MLMTTSEYTIYIIHGYNCTSDSFCLPRLKKTLQDKGYTVIVTDLPDTHDVALEKKVAFLVDNYHFDEKSVIIGVSMGSMVGLRLLEQLTHHIQMFISVAGSYEFEMNELKRTAPRFQKYREYFATHGQPQRHWEHILPKATSFHVIAGRHDATVSNRNTEKLATCLHVTPITVDPREDHFRGYEEPSLLDAIVTHLPSLGNEKKNR